MYRSNESQCRCGALDCYPRKVGIATMGCIASDYRGSKYFYFVGLVLTAVLTWVLRDYATSALGHVGPLRECLIITDEALKVKTHCSTHTNHLAAQPHCMQPNQDKSGPMHGRCQRYVNSVSCRMSYLCIIVQ